MSRQQKAVAFLQSTAVKSCWSDVGGAQALVGDGVVAGPSSSAHNSRSLLRPTTDSRQQQRTGGLSHQPTRQNEVRVKHTLQKYQELKQRSASALGNGPRAKSAQRQASGQAFGKTSKRGDAPDRAKAISGTGLIQTTSSSNGTATLGRPGAQGGATSMGDLLGPARRGPT